MVLAIIFGHNEPSLHLFESLGFARGGHLPGVTHMPDGRRDVEILGLHLA
jgi:phosphinothricin acetyltransferase